MNLSKQPIPKHISDIWDNPYHYFLATPQEINATNIETSGTLNIKTGEIQITEKSLPGRYRD